jgi:hypothetical protein
MAAAFCSEPSAGETARSNGSKSSASDSTVAEDNRVPVTLARDRAKTMHDIYAATLEVMHHRYFHGDRAVVPARAMEDVFTEIQRHSKIEARWISASMDPMSLDHKPESGFEKRAAQEIAAGKSDVEVIEDGYYRRAGAIPLSAGCVSCHGGFFRTPSKTPKFAGLVISVPINGDSGKPD